VLPDNQILASILALREANPDVPVVLVSKDINLRIKAAICGVAAEDYENDRALDDFSLLYTGYNELTGISGTRHKDSLELDRQGPHLLRESPRENEQTGIRTSSSTCPATSRSSCAWSSAATATAVLQIVDDYRSNQHAVWGILARNREQNFALNALMDPDIDFVTCSAPPAPARRCWRWPPAWPRRWTSSATARSS
jgi:PhoH-like ATPase